MLPPASCPNNPLGFFCVYLRMGAEGGVAVGLDGLPDAVGGVGVGDAGVAQVYRHVEAAVEGFDGGDSGFGAGVTVAEDHVAHLFQLFTLGGEGFAQ